MKAALKILLFLLAVWIAGTALLGFVRGPDHQSRIFEQLITVVPLAGYAHIIFGSLALILGGLQLSSRLRRWNLNVHKLIGNGYVACVLLSTIGAIVSLPFTKTPWPATSGFWLLAIVWPIVTLAGYPRGGNFDFRWHGKLMIYSYALTCAAISLRLLLIGLMAGGVSFPVAYPIAAWGGGLTNVVIAFFVLRFVESRRSSNSKAAMQG